MEILNPIMDTISTEENIPCTKEHFLDEGFLFKTDISEHELIIILKTKKIRSINFPDSSDLTIEVSNSNELFSTINRYLAQEKHVEKILFLRKDEIFHIWIVISGYNYEERRKLIYRKESELTNFLSKTDFHFDFYLIEPDNVEDVISSGATIIYDRTKV